MVWIEFVVCLAIIVAAGSSLAKYGDRIAERTGVGRVWVGVVILAAITSLPELASGISSVTFVGQPDLTMGDLFGSNLVNLAIIAIIDIFHRQGPILLYLGSGIVLSTVLSVTMIAVAAVSLYLAQNLLTIALFGRIGIYSILLFVMYLGAQYIIFKFQQVKGEPDEQHTSASPNRGESLRPTMVFFLAAAVATIGAGIWLATIGARISKETGLSADFVGTLFLAFCTSAPEIVVSISAARMGALDMAVGNMVGSNLFNMGVIIFVDDIFYAQGPVLQGVDMVHIVTALFAILMSCVIITGILFRPRYWLPAWARADSVFLAIIYIAAMVTLYSLGKQS